MDDILSLPSWLNDDGNEGSDNVEGMRLAPRTLGTVEDSTHSAEARSEAVIDALGKELREMNVEDRKDNGEEMGNDTPLTTSNKVESSSNISETSDIVEEEIKEKIENDTTESQTLSNSTELETDNAATNGSFERKEDPNETVPQSAALNNKHVDRRRTGVDAAAMEPMHPAVITTLHGLCSIISSESKTPKMVEMALECITLLTNGRYVSGVAGGRMKLEQQRKVSETNRTPSALAPGHDGRDGGLSFLGYVVESITRSSESPSELVQGFMAKALLSIMTCPKCGVHEAAMLQAVRSVFHVYLVGKTIPGKKLAKQTLVDMLKSVFNRMEAYDVMNKDSKDNEIVVEEEENHGGGPVAASGEDDDTDATAQTTATTISTASIKLDSVPTLSPTSKGDMSAAANIGAFASQYHTDSYLLFRALCKLSSKTLSGDENVVGMNTSTTATSMGANFFSAVPSVDPLALNSKILSLELILAIFEHCGDAFRNGEKFIYAVQSYLCVSLMKNCMSNHTIVAHLSLKIFLLLVKKFKTHLKSEIEVFVANIFLRVLESPNSPFEQKILVLEALRALCADTEMLTQLFLNYDCDFDAVNLYKDIVHHVTRISARSCAPSNAATVTKKEIDQEIDLSRTGLEVLVVILRSFLKALDLPGGDDKFDENDGSSSLSLLRQNLKLDITKESDFDEKIINRNITDHSTTNQVHGDHELNRMGSSNGFAEKIVNAFDKKRTAEQNFEIGMVKFTLSLKSGLHFFLDSGFVQLDARDMARFLYENKERLNKTQTGEVLGKETDAAFVKDKDATSEKGGKGFFLRVLHHYVDLINFEGLLFDEAIRLFLSGFRLPGEAQKVRPLFGHFYNQIRLYAQHMVLLHIRLIELWRNLQSVIHDKTQMSSLMPTLLSFLLFQS